ncbi:MAG: TIGR02281 family clan AA aspartic protease [Rhodobacteraceae bacterium]|nr:TIGR02281 family clan AA aspartic protease [Paracoccaceae bacterium]
MRALLILIVLGVIYLGVRSLTDIRIDVANANPVLLGYGALFTAGIVAAELLRPLMQRMSALSRFTIVAALAAIVWLSFEMARLSGRIPAALLDPQSSQQDLRIVHLPQAWDGLYRTIAQVNSQSLGVIIDTSTPLVILTYDEAERLGLVHDGLAFTDRVAVSDRKIAAALLPFMSVRVGDLEILKVDGAIAEPGALGTSLIGLSYLSRLKAAGVIGRDMVLQQ